MTYKIYTNKYREFLVRHSGKNNLCVTEDLYYVFEIKGMNIAFTEPVTSNHLPILTYREYKKLKSKGEL